MFYVDGITKNGSYKIMDTDDGVVDCLTYDKLFKVIKAGIFVGGTRLDGNNLIVKCKSENVWDDIADSVNKRIALSRFKLKDDFNCLVKSAILLEESFSYGVVNGDSDLKVYCDNLLIVIEDRGLVYSCIKRQFLNEINMFNKDDAPLLVDYNTLKSFNNRYINISGERVYLMDLYRTLCNIDDIFSFENILYIGGVSSSRVLYFVVRMPNALYNCYRIKLSRFSEDVIDKYYMDFHLSENKKKYLSSHIKYLLSIKTLKCYSYMISDIKCVKQSTSKVVAVDKLKLGYKHMYDIFQAFYK